MRAPIKTGIKFEKIEELIILGHSIKADEEIYEDMFKLMKHLKLIVIFKWQGEKEEEIEEKESILRKYSNCKIIYKDY